MKTNASNAVFYIANVNTIDDVKMCKNQISRIFYCNQVIIEQVIGGTFDYLPIFYVSLAIQGQQLMFQK